MTNELTKGDVVEYKGRWYRVTAVFKDTVNLGSVFGSKPSLKGVDKGEVKEDYENWHESWTKSESYQCM